MSAISQFLHRKSLSRPARLIKSGGTPYLYRIFLFGYRGWNVYLQRFVSPDSEPWLHDHPSHGVAIVLTGRYVEERKVWFDWPSTRTRRRCVSWLNWVNAHAFHRIVAPEPDTWTMFFHAPKFKGWGVLETRGKSVVYRNPFGNVGDTAWWLEAPTYGELVARSGKRRGRKPRAPQIAPALTEDMTGVAHDE